MYVTLIVRIENADSSKLLPSMPRPKMLSFIGIAVSDSVTFCINCLVKKCLEGFRCVYFKLSGILCVFMYP